MCILVLPGFFFEVLHNSQARTVQPLANVWFPSPTLPRLSLTNQTKFTRDTSVVFCLFFIEFLLFLLPLSVSSVQLIEYQTEF